MSDHVGRENGAKTGRSPPTNPGTTDLDHDDYDDLEFACGHDHARSTDHYAFIYDNDDGVDQLALAASFVRQGLERGERCLYVADDNSRGDVLTAMRSNGIDVDDALESGSLSLLTPAEMYSQDGEFDPEAMLEFWEETLAESKADGFTGLRATAEMTWAVGERASDEALVEYEALLNPLYRNEEYTVLCQYNRDEFSDAVVEDVLETHPYITLEDGVSENVYYEPPDTDEDETAVDQMLETAAERTETKSELRSHKRYLRELYEATANDTKSFAETVEQFLELGCKRFGVEIGFFARIHDDEFEILHARGSHEHIQQGSRDALERSYCQVVIDSPDPICTIDVPAEGWNDDLAYETYGLDCYIGTQIDVRGTPYGTLCFASTSPREHSFGEDEVTFLELMGEWITTELEREDRERAQRTLYEIAADTEQTFDEKVQSMFELGCDRFDMEFAGIATIDRNSDRLEVEVTNGGHERIVSGAQLPLSETYCRKTASVEETCAVVDPVEHGFADTLTYDRFDMQAYLGTHLDLEGEPDRTFWFASSEPRTSDFTESERTFHHLMGQWVTDELERQQYERNLERTVEQLKRSNDRLKQFAYAASHDLREPLRMISSYLQLLENRYGDELDEDAHEFIGFAVDGADRMRAMVDDLLAFSRVEQAEGSFETVDCNAVVERALNDLRVQIHDREARITVDPLPLVEGDREQLEQLFQNLVSNAIKYSGDGESRVDITATQRSGWWEIAISDNGIGIESEQTDRIFEVFRRLHQNDEYPGTGIGLSLCQKIVDNHGGDIWVESAPGVGSTFFVTLPSNTTE
ncbi:MEDS domain-containing protein [Natronorubrum daqingense]|uniref:histidine kinase n=1 Tax=Natronorubrum daqingense TaxID=588898 RepID=A0A1N7CA34_9EURY|nr:MEDS domain-containing protein [Natronorubrum daqingense]APX96805.1 hypothetical protein BB347_09330 [Natronorubrum daqingense]SIR60294.1 GAF domain-containing protein [Natronorubrum daqingense]